MKHNEATFTCLLKCIPDLHFISFFDQNLFISFQRAACTLSHIYLKKGKTFRRWQTMTVGYLLRDQKFHCRGSWLCDVIATITGCWAEVIWCSADSVSPSSSIFGRLAAGSPACAEEASPLDSLLTSTGGELDAWAARICREFRPRREIRKEGLVRSFSPDTNIPYRWCWIQLLM